MDALIDRDSERGTGEPHAARRLRAFRAADAFALAVWQDARSFARPEGALLAEEIRRTVARAGGSLVAAASLDASEPEARRAAATAHAGFLEVRYYLYLARRLGCLDLKRYRHLAHLQDAALGELGALLSESRTEATFPIASDAQAS